MPNTHGQLGIILSNIADNTHRVKLLSYTEEFKDSADSLQTIETLETTMIYAKRLIRILVQRAAAHDTLKRTE